MGNMVPCGPLWHKTSVCLMYCSFVGPHELTPTCTPYPSLTRISDRLAVRPTHFGVFQSWANTLGWPKFSAKRVHMGPYWLLLAHMGLCGPGPNSQGMRNHFENHLFLKQTLLQYGIIQGRTHTHKTHECIFSEIYFMSSWQRQKNTKIIKNTVRTNLIWKVFLSILSALTMFWLI